MYGLAPEGDPFRVFVRREHAGTNSLAIRFECKEGMGVLGLRKSGRTDPVPSPSFEEEEIDPGSLRAGRFVHVLPSGQRQSYALSRVSPEVAARMPTDRWVALKPHTEYGFRYLVAPDGDLDATTAAVQVNREVQTRPPVYELPRESSHPSTGPVARATPAPMNTAPVNTAPTSTAPTSTAPVNTGSIARPATIPIREATVPMPPSSTDPAARPRESTRDINDAALRVLTQEQAIEQLRGELQRSVMLQARVAELEDALRRSRSRERDLIELLAKWDR